MDSSVSTKDEIWFLRVCHHISNAAYDRRRYILFSSPSVASHSPLYTNFPTQVPHFNYIAPYAVFSLFPNIQAPSAMYQLSLLSPPITLCSSIMTFLPQAIAPCNLSCSSSTRQSLSPIYCWTQPSNSSNHLSLSLSLQNSNPQPHSATNTLDSCQPLPCK